MLLADPGSPARVSLWEAEVAHAINGTPSWFPFGTPVSPKWQIPLLPAPRFEVLPVEATAYDKRGTTPNPALLLHYYVQDAKLGSQLKNPADWVPRFAGFGGVIAPDFSIRDQDPPDRRVFAIRMSRAVGAFYVSRGLTVVPNVRWGDSRDFEYCFDGIQDGSVVAISNHGSWRAGKLRQGFLAGLR